MTKNNLPSIPEHEESRDMAALVKTQVYGMKNELMEDIRDLMDHIMASRDKGSQPLPQDVSSSPYPSGSTPPPPPSHSYTPPPWSSPRPPNPIHNYPSWPPNITQPSTSNQTPMNTFPSTQNPYTQTSTSHQNPINTFPNNQNPYTQNPYTQNPYTQHNQQWAMPQNSSPWAAGDPPQTHYPPRYRMEFPEFDSEDFKSWFAKFEQYLEMELVPDEYKPKVAMFAFVGPPLHWHQFYVNSVGGMANVRWPTYLMELKKRFASADFADPLFDLVRLRHTGTVRHYYDEFMSLLNIAGIPERQAHNIFLANLKDDVLGQLRLYRPSTLQQAAEMSILIEANIEAAPKSQSYTKNMTTTHIQTIPATGYTRPPPPKSTLPAILTSSKPNYTTSTTNNSTKPNTTTNSSTTPNGNFKKPTPAEIADRKRKGLCFWCQAKYSPGHKCLGAQVYSMVVSDEDESMNSGY
ncbi:hypothetical protein COLO4_33282 [Corchorus olitorius]|uniref:Retrotransposon gag protein n=1 Tax=Corchorus olitorius TaxID=93759 RepID=A0A1R3GV99_9ROSI|nr:hypothetical protein COLO4_33282 [Corchorus olitorius]